MVLSSNPNRSPSPISSRTNPNSRSQESSGIRKSFSGDPFTRPSIVPNPRGFNPVTPANSPADFHQRNSSQNSSHREGLASLRVSYEQKENEKNQIIKPARVRSPAVSTGTKSFMAPTVSAASKINASPRKKVLTERNEAVRTSTSFSAGKSPVTAMNPSVLAEEIRSKLETIFDSKVHSEGSQKPVVTLVAPVSDELMIAANPEDDGSSIADAFVNPEVPTEALDLSLFSPEPRAVDSRCTGADLGSKIRSCLSPSPVLAPLDMDPCPPPYDPKTNYLSPRPQFLHYKPNPRIEVYFNKELEYDDTGEGKRLEERFSSESSSETEITEESHSPSPEKEYEDAASSEMMPKEKKENHSSEPELTTTQDQNQVLRANETRKLHLLARSKSISLLLVLVVACLCFPVTDTPIHYPSLFKSQAISKFDSPARIAELAKTKLHVLSHDVQLWSVSSVSYLSKLISFPNEMEEAGLLEFVNSTSSDEKHLADLCETVDYGYNDTGKIQDIETEENAEEEGIANIQTNVEFEEQPQGEFLEEGDIDLLHNNVEPTNVAVAEKCSNTELEEQSSLLPEVQDVKPVILEAGSEGENDADSPINIDPADSETTAKISGSDYSHGSVNSLDAPESSLQGSNYRFPEGEVLGISSIILTLLIAALLYLKQNKASAPKASVPVEQSARKKLSLCSISASSDNLNEERRIWPAEVEKVGESGPSEMSSTVQGSSTNHGKKASDRANEVQSHERKSRRSAKRESSTSASEFSAESPSYGSFTTYEKFQSKHKSGDEEMVTPVRRSSRIKKQIITSP
ncbi:uncharacterized protein LOC122658418 isoform X2 [Telopea speciosissima]|uniref:uncharacterized protein LOC122658418 isoform X2 n=1 Tax=Telopea speciosissima TaxID=54955 RepID=UPI001CC7896D|nr:uncharacterized protein LOC122658418 isoform X2 [Telopea speciosissima]